MNKSDRWVKIVFGPFRSGGPSVLKNVFTDLKIRERNDLGRLIGGKFEVVGALGTRLLPSPSSDRGRQVENVSIFLFSDKEFDWLSNFKLCRKNCFRAAF